MRKTFFILGLSVFAACNSGTDTKVESMSTKDSTTAPASDVVLPYTTDYSSKFEMGDMKNVQTILELYKDWDNNNLDNSRSKFADSVTLVLSDGTTMKGSFDSINNATKPYRNKLGTVTSSVHAIFPVKSTDKNENWVVAWFTEHRTNASGKKDSVELQETWRINKDGKADLLYQYQQQNPAPPKK